jgi:hypothetical protein
MPLTYLDLVIEGERFGVVLIRPCAQAITCWQYVNSLLLWGRMLCAYPGSNQLHALVYPFVQVRGTVVHQRTYAIIALREAGDAFTNFDSDFVLLKLYFSRRSSEASYSSVKFCCS